MPKVRISLLIERHAKFEFGLEIKILSNTAIQSSDQISRLPFPETLQARFDFLERLEEDNFVVPPGPLLSKWYWETNAESPQGVLVQRWSTLGKRSSDELS